MKTYTRLKSLGHSDSEASQRASEIDSSRRNARYLATSLGLAVGEVVVVQYQGEPAVARCVPSDAGPMLIVGGCVSMPGMIRVDQAVAIDAGRMI